MAFAKSARVTIDRSALKRLTGPNGPVDADARAKAVKVARIARTLVGVSPGPQGGRLRSSIRVSPSRRPAWNVEAGRNPRVPYAYMHHQGTRAHDIGSPVFIFGVGWRYIGRSPAGRGKKHPGTKANPYLTEAARRVGLKVRVKGGR